ncbi:MAG: hypothetical protein HRT37_16570 [Alteromonadaceae bacterium]|nr:hypothetical protein [Alteromonadaceae bacterium]
MAKGIEDIFEKDSVIKTLILCVLTLGIYLIYVLYKFSLQINNKSDLKISKIFIMLTISLFAISFASLIVALVNFHDPEILRASIWIHIVSSIFDISWIIMVRNHINSLTCTKKGDKLWLNSILTSFLHVIYMQHKINQGLDARSTNTN